MNFEQPKWVCTSEFEVTAYAGNQDCDIILLLYTEPL